MSKASARWFLIIILFLLRWSSRPSSLKRFLSFLRLVLRNVIIILGRWSSNLERRSSNP
jgi:hypothetical protein